MEEEAEKKEIDYQSEYLKLLGENKELKDRNDELFKVVVSFNGQKPVVDESVSKQEQKTEQKKIVLKDLKF